MNRRRSSLGVLKWDSLPDPGTRFVLGNKIASGVSSEVFEAQDTKDGRNVAIKIEKFNDDNSDELEEEFNVLLKLSEHPNLPDFYGAFRKDDHLWLVMEHCKGGSVGDLVRSLHKEGRALSELHIAFILREVVKAVLHLHNNHVMHRDIRANNILLSSTGEVNLIDFGISRELKSTMGKRGTSVGSPSWMAPELITSTEKNSAEIYDNRVDVWALGITAIELADCKAPYEGIHPTRALFQIVRNPPPTLRKPANWSQMFNDFITECLEKTPENRAYMMELEDHPFFNIIPENDLHVPMELKAIADSIKLNAEQTPEVLVRTSFLQSEKGLEQMYHEDLAAIRSVNEEVIIEQLQNKLQRGNSFTFLGDVLLFLNPNVEQDIYNEETHRKYNCKSRSDNISHIYAVADRAYQDVQHHEEAQHIIFNGESLSGKTTNMLHALQHLLWLGKGNIAINSRIMNAVTVIHTLGNASTPLHNNSTRHILNTHVTFTNSGKISGAIFWLYQLERWRITSSDEQQGNFHVLYYFYSAKTEHKELDKFGFENNKTPRYLRNCEKLCSNNGENNLKYENFLLALRCLEFKEEDISTIENLLAAILNLGEIKFKDVGDGKAEIENPNISAKVAKLLDVEEKKFNWALTNYCIIERGQAERRKQSPDEAAEVADALARVLYSRLVDYIVNLINLKLSFTRLVFGDRHMVSLFDCYGFECYQKNTLEQLMINSLNEQLQYFYTQHLFAWEMQDREEEDVSDAERITYYNNRLTVDLLMAKSTGILWLIDEATRTQKGPSLILDELKKSKTPYCQASANANEFSVAHYTGKVNYDARDLYEKNRDFVPPEMTEALRISKNPFIREMFTNPLSRTGNLTQSKLDIAKAAEVVPNSVKSPKNSKWSAVLMSEKCHKSSRSYNTLSRGQFSQTRRMRTPAASFRAVCLEVLKGLSHGGTHFVKCIRPSLTGQPNGFQKDVVRQQIRALSVIDTVRARQSGYPCRVPFSEFLRRYKFLAFDFDENVEENADNCRLLMVRLKMEGYAMGKTKMFLKYYNEEYLARLYENQVKKIVKIQAMLRTFLTKRRIEHAPIKKPGALAGLGSSKDEGNDTEIVPTPITSFSRFRNPLESITDYLEDDDEN